MSNLRPMLAVFTIIALLAPCVLAQDKPAALSSGSADSIEALKKENSDAYRAWRKDYTSAYTEAQKNGKEKEFKFAKSDPTPAYARRFLAIAEKNPDGPEAIPALEWAFRLTFTAKDGEFLKTRLKVIKMFRNYYIAKPQIKSAINTLMSLNDEDSRALIADVIARNPDHQTQAAAYMAQLNLQMRPVMFADYMKDPKHLAEWEKELGKDAMQEKLLEAEKARIEAEAIRKILRENYGDVYSDLAIGNPAPEIKIPALDGSAATLSALKGKVVVLDIWTTWCPPCLAMIPHEREMVERLKDKPFQLVSISFDAKKEALTSFLAKEKMPWTHWWNGDMDGSPMESWAVSQFPTIYILDAKGVIRHKQLGDDPFDKIVDALLQEMEPKKTAAK